MSATNTATVSIKIEVDGKGGIKAIREVGDESKKAGDKGAKAFKGSADAIGAYSGRAGKALDATRLLGGAFAGITAVGALGGFISLLKDSVISLANFERLGLRTDSLIRATGNAAGLSRKALEDYAKQLDLATLGDRDGIMQAINALQTFRSVQGETFTRAISLASDLSEVLGVDLRGQVVQLGKALEDPITGMTALRRVGVSFTQQQMDQAKALVQSNQKLEAQRMILDEIERQVGGSAAAAAGGLLGKLDTLNYRWRELKEQLADSVGASKLASGGIDMLSKSLEKLSVINLDNLKPLMGGTLLGPIGTLLGAADAIYTQRNKMPDNYGLGKYGEFGAPHDIAAPNSEDMTAEAKSYSDKQLNAFAKDADEYVDLWREAAEERYDILSRSYQNEIDLDQETQDRIIQIQKASAKKYTDLWQIQAKDRYEVQIRGIEALIEADDQMSAHMIDLSNRTADAMQQNFSDLFFDVMQRKFDSLSDYINAVTRSIQRAGADITGQFVMQNLFSSTSNAPAAVRGYAHGDVFSGRAISAYENSIVDRPTFFKFAQGAAVMGEAGAEAVMPLTRTSSGDLGVKALAPQIKVEINPINESGMQLEVQPRIVQQSMDKVVANMVIKRKMTSRDFRGPMGS